MTLYDIKEFLTLDDVAEYLADRCNYDFNLESSIDQNRLIETIIQLVRSRKLNPVFHYRGNVDWLEKKVITRKSGRFNNHEIVLTDIKHDMRVNDYYFVSDRDFNRLIENNCSNYINIINCTIEPYHVDGKQEIVENKILDYRKVKEDFSIIFYDLLYPKLDLDKLFSQTEADTDTIEKLKEQITHLKNQLAQAKAELADKPADDNTEQDHLYNWQAMDKNQYPPELHLAIEIWTEYYQADVIKHITQFDAGRFNRITKNFNLSDGNLKSRIRSLLTPLESKLKSPSLIDSLKEIDIIHTDKLEQE